MSRRVALVSCVKSKTAHAAPAGELYTSDLFRKMKEYARANSDAWFILSAEHGLLSPMQVIEPYERTLNKMGKADRAAWARKVKQQLAEAIPHGAEVLILAGERYREDLVPFLKARGCKVQIPLEGMPFGKQLQYLAAANFARKTV